MPPRYWNRLPLSVRDAPTLAAWLHAKESTPPRNAAFPALRVATRLAVDLLGACPPGDAAAMYSVVEALEARRDAAGGGAAIAAVIAGAGTDAGEEAVAWDALAGIVRHVAENLGRPARDARPP